MEAMIISMNNFGKEKKQFKLKIKDMSIKRPKEVNGRKTKSNRTNKLKYRV